MTGGFASKRPGPAPPVAGRADPADLPQAVVDGLADHAVHLLSPTGTVTSWNAGAERTFRYAAEEILGRDVAVLSPPDDRAAGRPAGRLRAAAEHGTHTDECWRVRRDGSAFWASVTLTAIRGEGGALRGFWAVTRDLSERRAAQETLATAHRTYAGIFEALTDGVLLFDVGAGGRPALRRANQAASRLFGMDPPALAALFSGRGDPPSLRDGDGSPLGLADLPYAWTARSGVGVRCRVWDWQTADGTVRWFSSSAEPVVDGTGATTSVVFSVAEVTERLQAERRQAHEAVHDPLTGLANRAMLLQRLGDAAARGSQPGQTCLLSLDLDHFKHVNDSLGHAAGDEVLLTVARRLRTMLRTDDLVARLAGDEFAAVVCGVYDERSARELAERARTVVGAPVEVGGRRVSVGCSVGVTLTGGPTAEAMLQEADTALHTAKSAGRGRSELYDQAMRVAARQRLDAEDLLRGALGTPAVQVHYQPILDLPTGQPIGVEALVRLTAPDGVLVQPDRFVPVAEETGLIVPLGRDVLRAACSQRGRWARAGSPITKVGINVSARQLESPTLVDDVADALAAARLTGSTVCLELTESSLLRDDRTTRDVLHRLAETGAAIALDDFGTGMSSLAHLRQFPIDIIKIDRSFVSGLGLSAGDTELVRAVIGLGAALGLDVVAEGIETAEQQDALRSLGCPHGQGYLYSRPVPAAELDSWIAQRAREHHRAAAGSAGPTLRSG